MTFMTKTLPDQKQNLTTKHAAWVQERGLDGGSDTLLGIEMDEEGDSDPEGDFWKSLSSREKRKLLQRLEEIESGKRPRPMYKPQFSF